MVTPMSLALGYPHVPSPYDYKSINYLDNVRLSRVTYTALRAEPTSRRMGPIDQMLHDQAGGFGG